MPTFSINAIDVEAFKSLCARAEAEMQRSRARAFITADELWERDYRDAHRAPRHDDSDFTQRERQDIIDAGRGHLV